MPENRVEKLLPVWPVAPLNQFQAAARKPHPVGESEKDGGGRRRNRTEKDASEGPDEGGHLDLYA